MKRGTPSKSGSVVDRLAALGEPVRLRLLRVLEAEELLVGEVAQVVQLPQSTVSRHLKVLADGGWLAKRSEGTATLYRLVLDDLAPEARALWRAVRDQMDDPILGDDARRLRGVLDERKTDSQTFFGRYGGEWDELRTELFGRRFTPLALLSLLRRDWVVADIGCGTGNAAELVAPVVERVVAVDRSGPMLAAARRRLAGAGNVEFVEGDAEHTGLPDASVDVAMAFLVLHHLDDPQAAVREAARILRPDRGAGVLLVVDMVEHDRVEYRRTMGHRHLGFAPEVLEGLARRAGLNDFVYRELPVEAGSRGPALFAATARRAAHSR